METTGNKVISGDFARLLDAFKRNINRNLNVAEVGIVKAKNNDGTYTCELLNYPEFLLTCFTLHNEDYSLNTLVLILFSNSDFRINLSKYNTGQASQKITKEDYHSKDYAIIIGTGSGASSVVKSVNGKTGDVVLNYNDVGALPASIVIPTKTSQLTNDSGFITSADIHVKTYSGIISENDWTLMGARYVYTLSASVHNLTNPIVADYLVESSNGYSRGMCNYEVLTNRNIYFTSDIAINVKYTMLGE